MHARRRLSAALSWLGPIALVGLLVWASLAARSAEPEPNVIELNSALTTGGAAEHFPADQASKLIALPDEWSNSRPREDGPVWYRLSFDAPVGSEPLLAAYIERVCSNAEVHLNGVIIYSGGRMTER